MDEKEFTAFYKANYKSLVSYVYSKTRNADDAEEIVQEAFSQFLNSYDSDFLNDRFTFLYKVCGDCMKKFWRSPIRSEKVLDFNSRLLQTLVQDLSVDVEDEFIRKEEELTGIINEELELIPHLYRDIIKLYYYEDKTQDEIAEIIAKWQPNISLAIEDGKKMLKVRLKKRGIK
jgi:RNA polymerase sigma-70 factor (ECF subfamily)